MERPLEVTFRDVERTPPIEDLIRERAGRLEKFSDNITGCRVAVERPHKHETSGNPYRVRIDVTIPRNNELVVTKNPKDNDLNDPLDRVIINAFQAMERQIKDLSEVQQGDVKTHPEPYAFVVRLFDDYGFMKTEGEREIYFHKNAVADDAFERLEIGTAVRFTERQGEKGPQASTVQIVDKPGARVTEEDAVSPPPGWEK